MPGDNARTDPGGRAAARADTSRIRASDRERDATAVVLWQACAAGRLDLAETRARAGAAYTARTRGQLHALIIDLPQPPSPPGSIKVAEEVWHAGEIPALGAASLRLRWRTAIALAGLAAAATLIWWPAAGIISVTLVLLAVLAAAHSIRQAIGNLSPEAPMTAARACPRGGSPGLAGRRGV